jgi:hypothetical protein
LSIEPAVFGTQVTRTMYASLHGEFMPHPRLDAAPRDAYGLFYARSAAMGWLTPAAGNDPCGLWGMNDAEASPGSGPRPGHVAFFQVALTGPAQGRLLPVQQFLSCAGDVMARLGTLHLEAVKVLLPEHDAADGRPASPSGIVAAVPLLDVLNWFAGNDSRLRTQVRITLDSGPDPSICAAARAIVQWAQEINQDVFACDSFSLADDDHLVLRPATAHEGELDADRHRVTFRGTLAEWSLDSLGWLAAFLADMSSRQGVNTPLVFTADRSAPAI